jgi:hypothetical protein
MLQYLIEHYVVDLVVDGQVYGQFLENSEIFTNESLGGVFFVHEVHRALVSLKLLVGRLAMKDVFGFLLTAQGVSIE